MYGPGDYDLAGFTVGAVERDRLIDGSTIRAGDAIIGLPSSGPHSNGYSLIRRVLDRAGGVAAERERAEALLAPTRIYVDAVRPLLDTHPIRGMAHITGGGLTENIVRVVPDELGIELDGASWTPPDLFGWLAQVGRIEPAEMRRTFNLGVGFVLIVQADAAEAVLRALDEAGEASLGVIGRVIDDAGADRVRYRDA